MPEPRTDRDNQRLKRLGVLLLLALVIAAAVSSVIASDEDLDSNTSWLGQDADSHPELGNVPDAFDPSRGMASNLDDSPEQARSSEPEGYAGFQQVFHPDERERVTPTTSFPASAIAQIEMYRNGSLVGTCTGTFVGPNAVLTAGHCLYMENTGWADAVAVVPGRDGSTEPYGYQWASSAWAPQEWIDSQDAFWDWGILKMPDSSLGNTVGWFEMGVLQTSSLNASNFNPVIAGYPGEKAFGTQWMGIKSSFSNVTSAHLYYMIDTSSGQSGAAFSTITTPALSRTR